MKRARGTNGDFDAIAADLAQLRSDLEHLTDALKDGAVGKGKQAFADVAGEAGALEEMVERVVQEHPVRSVLLAAAIGLAVGTMLWR